MHTYIQTSEASIARLPDYVASWINRITVSITLRIGSVSVSIYLEWGSNNNDDDDDDDDNVLCVQVGPSNILNSKVVLMTIFSFFLKLSNYYQRK